MRNFLITAILMNTFQLRAVESHPPTEKADAVAMNLLKTLKTQLTQKMSTEGLAGAMDFCSLNAGVLTEKVNSEIPQGWSVKRVSAKNRNPDNALDEIDFKANMYFQKAQKNPSLWLEEKVNGKHLASRYYKPLKVEATCLACHGTNLSDVVTNVLKTKYPKDLATGYKVGDLRGLVRVRIPAEQN